MTTQLTPYSGPRPAPARRWAPWVVAICAILVALNLVSMALNLGERQLQQQAETGVPQVTRIQAFLSAVRLVGYVSATVAIAFLVVNVGWTSKRRTRKRVAQYGESGVEPSLWYVSHGACALCCLTLAASLGLTALAHGSVHVGMRRSDFVDYRTYLAAGNACRAVMWGCWVVLVRKSTVIQDRRESLTNGNQDPDLSLSAASSSGPVPRAAAEHARGAVFPSPAVVVGLVGPAQPWTHTAVDSGVGKRRATQRRVSPPLLLLLAAPIFLIAFVFFATEQFVGGIVVGLLATVIVVAALRPRDRR